MQTLKFSFFNCKIKQKKLNKSKIPNNNYKNSQF